MKKRAKGTTGVPCGSKNRSEATMVIVHGLAGRASRLSGF